MLLGQFKTLDVNRILLPVPVIHGVGGAKSITLWNAIQDQFGFAVPGTVEQHFSHMRILEGRLLADRRNVQFTGLNIYAANFGPWSSAEPIRWRFTAEDPNDFSYHMTRDRTREIDMPGDDLTLMASAMISTRNEAFSRYGFDVFPNLHIDLQTPKEFDDAMSTVRSMRRVFSLLIGIELVPERIVLEVDGGKKLENIVNVLFEHPPTEYQAPMPTHEVLVPFPHIEQKVQEIFHKWVRDEARIKDAVDLFIATVREDRLARHVELTTLAQSLETFHRNVYGGGYMEKEAYEPFREMMVKSIPEQFERSHHDALKKRIQYGYEFSFRTRLKQLAGRFSDEHLNALGIEKKKFPDEVTDARNTFTHWDSETGKPRLTGADLSNLITKLKAFTRLVLLSHLGISADTVVQRMVQNKYLYLPESKNVDHG